MTIQHQERETVDREVYDELRAEVTKLRDQLTAIRAAVNADEPDYLRDIYAATERLYALLKLPDERPGSWEAAHVRALEEPLCEILDALRAERPEPLTRTEDGGRGDDLMPDPVDVLAPVGALGWSAGRGFITDAGELLEANGEGELVVEVDDDQVVRDVESMTDLSVACRANDWWAACGTTASSTRKAKETESSATSRTDCLEPERRSRSSF